MTSEDCLRPGMFGVLLKLLFNVPLRLLLVAKAELEARGCIPEAYEGVVEEEVEEEEVTV